MNQFLAIPELVARNCSYEILTLCNRIHWKATRHTHFGNKGNAGDKKQVHKDLHLNLERVNTIKLYNAVCQSFMTNQNMKIN